MKINEKITYISGGVIPLPTEYKVQRGKEHRRYLMTKIIGTGTGNVSTRNEELWVTTPEEAISLYHEGYHFAFDYPIKSDDAIRSLWED